MKFHEYSFLALRTESLPDHFLSGHLYDYRFTHACLGLGSEMAEIVLPSDIEEEINPKEELGDFFWYLNVACNVNGISLELLDSKTLDEYYEDPVIDLQHHIGILQDQCKRSVYYHKSVDATKIHDSLLRIFMALLELCDQYELDVDDVLDANISKLEKRYPKLRFDAFAAVNRNLDAEKEALG